MKICFIFNALDAKEMEIVIAAMEEKAFKAGEVVITQGDEGNNLFVVDSGTFTCVRQFVLFLFSSSVNTAHCR